VNEPLRLERLTGSTEQVATLQAVLDGAPNYFRLLTGRDIQPTAAADLFAALPPGQDPADKHLFAIRLGSRWIGCIDLIRHYPNESSAFVGLHLIVEDERLHGMGTRAYQALETLVLDWPECERIGLAVAESNAPVLAFWEKLGFGRAARSRTLREEQGEFRVILMIKELRASNAAGKGAGRGRRAKADGQSARRSAPGARARARSSGGPRSFGEPDAAMIDTIFNFRRASHHIATAGQPTARQLAALAPAGFEAVINLLPVNDEQALAHEGDIVRSLGMEYVHIPVAWSRPSARALRAFCDYLAAMRGKMLFIHCAANYRVAVFLALYRIQRRGWQPERAFREMRRVWIPNPDWVRFIDRILGREVRSRAAGQRETREIRKRVVARCPRS